MTDTPRTSSAGTGDGAGETKALRDRVENLKTQVDALKERVDEAKSWVEGRASVANAWASRRREKVKDLVAEEPMTAVTVSSGVAFLIGIGAGLLLGRLFDER